VIAVLMIVIVAIYLIWDFIKKRNKVSDKVNLYDAGSLVVLNLKQ